MNTSYDNFSLILFDIDGTLIPKQGSQISVKTLGKLNQLINEGFLFSIITGRGIKGVEKFLAGDLGELFRLPVAVELGSKIYDVSRRQTLFYKEIDTLQAVNFLSSFRILTNVQFSYWSRCSRRKIYTLSKDLAREHEAIYGQSDHTKDIHLFMEWIRDDRPTLIRIQLPQGAEHQLLPGPRIRIHPFSSGKGMEITDSSITKATGAQTLLTFFTEKPLSTVFVGNSDRDKEMFKVDSFRGYIVGKSSHEQPKQPTIDAILDQISAATL